MTDASSSTTCERRAAAAARTARCTTSRRSSSRRRSLRAIRDRNALDTRVVDDVVLGCVTPIGEQGADIARVAALVAGFDETVPGKQLNRFCASGLEAVNTAAAQVMSGQSDVAIGGGVESMSRVPMGSGRRRLGDRSAGRLAPVLRAAGHQRRPDRDARRLQPRNGRRLRGREPAPRRARTAGRAGSTARSSPVTDVVRRDRARARRVPATRHDAGGSREAQARVRAGSARRRASTRSRSRRYPQVEAIEHVHTAGNSSGIVDGAAAVLVGNPQGCGARRVSSRAHASAPSPRSAASRRSC